MLELANNVEDEHEVIDEFDGVASVVALNLLDASASSASVDVSEQ